MFQVELLGAILKPEHMMAISHPPGPQIYPGLAARNGTPIWRFLNLNHPPRLWFTVRSQSSTPANQSAWSFRLRCQSKTCPGLEKLRICQAGRHLRRLFDGPCGAPSIPNFWNKFEHTVRL